MEVVRSESSFPWPLPPALVVADGEAVAGFVTPAVSVTGHTVVDTTIVSVVTKVVFELTGQFGTAVGQAVMVAVRVERMIEVTNSTEEDPETILD